MLDSETKKHIDSARQILVGKIPDPKAQVEQITTTLIYKFMDDMDREVEELGGKASFLVKDLEEFRWGKLMSRELSGQERMDLYVRALKQFSKSEQIPEVFRHIFKDAFLPYRDPETLSLFLKEIDWFSYDNSENLGNAFEYLLSVLGSQGDAGQFRTPRHIIDFITEVVDPAKIEKILDPACGTAGFLISAYKHIVHKNSSNYDDKSYVPTFAREDQNDVFMTEIQSNGKYKGDLLNPSDKKKLAANIHGYDISPDMVRLSLVNLYLHDFKSQNIHEYDTLSSDSRWDENFDVILANPPFMSPKGGVRPHKKFQIQANRAEVLFIDYIIEHLSINGRAGIIVPEGIIFQSSGAYKDLRKMLMENGLFSVVSLPSGVFQPYSGVKTSILFLDKSLAKKTDEILFVDIGNDGFDLGAQRRRIKENDLPQAYKVIKKWKKVVNGSDEYLTRGDVGRVAHTVLKSEIAENGDYNLSGNRYRKEFNVALLENIAKIANSFSLPDLSESAKIAKSATDNYKTIIENITPSLTWIEKEMDRIQKQNVALASSFSAMQKAINASVPDFSAIASIARQMEEDAVTELYPMVELDQVCDINPKKSEIKNLAPDDNVSFVPMKDISENKKLFIPQSKKKFSEVSGNYTYFAENDVLLAKVTPCFENGKSGIARNLANGIGFGSSELVVLRASEQILPDLLYYFVSNKKFREIGKKKMTGTGGLQRIPTSFIKSYKIPLPPLKIQEEIVKELGGNQGVIDGARKIVENWKPSIKIKPEWETKSIGDVIETITPPAKISKSDYLECGRYIIIDQSQNDIAGWTNNKEYLVKADTPLVIFGDHTCVVKYIEEPFAQGADGIKIIKTNPQLLPKYLYFLLLYDPLESEGYKRHFSKLKRHKIQLPPLEEQQRIVAEIEDEEKSVEAAKKLIAKHEAKTEERISGLWGN